MQLAKISGGWIVMVKYIDYWLPFYKRQYFKYKLLNDYQGMVELIDNIWRNWNLTTEEKRKIIYEIKGNI